MAPTKAIERIQATNYRRVRVECDPQFDPGFTAVVEPTLHTASREDQHSLPGLALQVRCTTGVQIVPMDGSAVKLTVDCNLVDFSEFLPSKDLIMI